MRRGFAGAVFVAVLLAQGAAFACGAAFGASVKVDTYQDIIVVWKDGVETYVFQPTFCGTSTDFGLILPVPAQVAQQPTLSDQVAFTTAATLSEPTKVAKVHKQAACIAIGGGSEAGTKGSVGPTVVASGRVGFLDWVQLKADTLTPLTDWLTTNGYPYSSSSTTVFSYYIDEGWYFLAFRISQQAAPSGGTICQALGPIALSFPTSVPVVPTRMASASSSKTDTSVSSQRIAWRIFGITHADADLAFADGTSTDRELVFSGAIPPGNVAAFGGLAESGDRLTRLMLTFYTGTSDPDIGLDLKSPPQDYRGTIEVDVTDEAACTLGQDGRSAHSFLLTLIGLALLGLVCWRRWR